MLKMIETLRNCKNKLIKGFNMLSTSTKHRLARVVSRFRPILSHLQGHPLILALQRRFVLVISNIREKSLKYFNDHKIQRYSSASVGMTRVASVILNKVKDPFLYRFFATLRMTITNVKSTVNPFRSKLNGLNLKPRIAVMALSVISIFISGLFLIPKTTEAGWFNSAWQYRKAVTVNLSSGSQTNYQVEMNGSTLGLATLVSAGKLSSDCSDIRFTDVKGVQLPYWVEDKSDSMDRADCTGNPTVWVKVPSVTSGDNTLYFYYGNPVASSESDPQKVFEFYDGFETSSLDSTNKWNSSGTPAFSSGSIQLDNSDTLVSKSATTDSSGLGRLITRVKQAVTTLTGGKIGFSNTSSTSSHFNTDDSATIIVGSTEETVSAIGSTNLVSNYQLEETTSTDANQFKASGYFDTGKLSQAVSVYGNAAGTQGSTLTFNRGAQISGNNFEHINTNQATISFWIKPSWNGNDNLQHTIWDGNINYLYIYKHTNNNLYFEFLNGGITLESNAVNISSWTANTWYHVVVQWDTRNTLNGTNYVNIAINGTSNYLDTTPGSGTSYAAGSQMYIGSTRTGNAPIQGLIDDFAIYDRVFTTTEISSLYNSGTGNEAGYVADPSLKFYAKLDGSGTLSPVTYNAGASASKLTAKSTELTGGINIVTNSRFQGAAGGIPTSWASSGSPTLSDAESANILFDSRAQKIVANSAIYGEGLGQSINVNQNENYHLSAWIKSDGTHLASIGMYDNTHAGWIAGYVVGDPKIGTTSSAWTKIQYDFQIPSGCSQISIQLRSDFNVSHTFYVQEIGIVPNSVVNGGMEGALSSEAPSGWVEAWNYGTGSAETSTQHSGSQAYKYTHDASASSGGIRMSSAMTIDDNLWYLISFWGKADSAFSLVGSLNGGEAGALSAALTTAWQKFTYIKLGSNFNGSAGVADKLAFYTGNANKVFYVDDVSVIPLDNVATSFKAWTPVSDSPGGNISELIVNGDMETGNPPSSWTPQSDTGWAREGTIIRNGTYSGKITYGATGGRLADQTITTIIGNTYQVKFSAHAGNSSGVYVNVGGIGNSAVVSSSSWQEVTYIFVATSTNSLIRLAINGSAGVYGYFDDVSIKEVANPLSVQGDSDGVVSTTSGARGNAYTFDGSTGYLRQKTYDVGVGTITYQDTNTDISDDGQEFEDWDNDNSGSAEYMIVVTNSDNTVSWGYFCANDGGTQTAVYTLKACTGGAEGFNGTSPSGKTPVGYEVRKTDYQITGDLTIGTWIKRSAIGYADTVVSKFGSSSAVSSYLLRLETNNTIMLNTNNSAAIYSDTTITSTSDWYFIVATLSGTTGNIYINGILDKTGTINNPRNDGPSAIAVGAASACNSTGIPCWYFHGSIDSPFVISSALTVDQIKDIYNSTASHYGLTTNNETVNTSTANASNPTNDISSQTWQIVSGSSSSILSQNGTTITTNTTNLPNEASYVRMQNSSSSALQIDWIGVAKQASTAPTITATGNEVTQQNAVVANWPLTQNTFDSRTNSLADLSNPTDAGVPPVLWMSMDDNDIDVHSCVGGGSVAGACDVSGNGNHGTANGSMTDSDYVTGKIGPKALDFDGTDDYLLVTDASSLRPSGKEVSIEAWVNFTGAIGVDDRVISKTTGNKGYTLRISNTDSTQLQMYIGDGAAYHFCSGVHGMSSGSWNHVTGTYDGTKFKLYVNGLQITECTEAFTPDWGLGNDVKINFSGAPYIWNGLIDEAKVFDYARTEDQIKADYNNTRAYFGAGSTAPIWSVASDVIQSASEGSTVLSFDGTDDYLTVADNIKLSPGSSNYSMSAWIKTSASYASNAGWIFSNYGSTAANMTQLVVGTDNKLICGFRDGSSNTLQIGSIGNAVNDGKWHFVSCVKNGTSAYSYIDGVQIGTVSNGSIGTINTTGLAKTIGTFANGIGTQNFNGNIAGVKIFNYALSSAQIKTQFESGINGIPVGTSVILSGSEGSMPPTTSNGLVGYWKLDGDANDASGNNNNGTVNGNTSYIAGKYNQAASFDGSGDYVDSGNGSSLSITNAITVSVWINKTANGGTYKGIVDKGRDGYGAWSLNADETLNTVTFKARISGTNYAIPAATTYITGQWEHYVGIYDGSRIAIYRNGALSSSTNVSGSLGTSGANLRIGAANDGYYFNGQIDEVKIYNRTLSDQEIEDLYNRGLVPVAKYTLDENGGTLAKDSVGNNAMNISQVYLTGIKPTWVEGVNASAISLNGVDNAFQTSENTGGLVGWWKMDEVSWNGTANEVVDSSSYVNHGISVGGVATTTTTAKFGKAGSFDGATARVRCATNPSTFNPGSSAHSFSAWVRPTAYTNLYNYITAIGNNSVGEQSSIGITNTGALFVSAYTSPLVTTTYIIPSLNNWYYISLIYNNGIAYFYVNGTLVESESISLSTTTGKCTIGSNLAEASYNFTGQIDDVRIYNRALSSNEINDLYNQSKLSPTGSVSLSASVKPQRIDSGSASGMTVGGTVVSKGDNYQLSTVSHPELVSGSNVSRSSFTTNAITSQLSGTSINDVYFYDTTKDSVDSTWRFDSTKSWYSETIDATFRNCNPATHDRCGSREFPEKAYIVATDNNVYIFDAQENAMWMRFDEGPQATQYYLSYYPSGYTTSVFALNGGIYIGSTGATGVEQNALRVFDFTADNGRYYIDTVDATRFNNTIANRNTTTALTTINTIRILSRKVNDVHAAVINGKTYVAVATDGGVSLINETDGTVVNFTGGYVGNVSGKVQFDASGNLYFTQQTILYVFYTNNAKWATGSSAVSTERSWFYSYLGLYGSLPPSTFAGVQNFYISSGTSTIDGTSNTIYAASTSGLSIIQEKRGDESNGSSKFVSKDYISEELIGDHRGFWSFYQTSVADGAAISGLKPTVNYYPDDIYLTSSNGATVVPGVRGNAFQFNGSSQYLVQTPATTYAASNVDADRNFGNAGATQWRAQGVITNTYYPGTIRLWLKKVGTPADNLTVELQTDASGVPSGTPVTNGVSQTVDGSTLGASYGWVNFRFANRTSGVSATNPFWIVVKRSGANDGSNYYAWGVDTSAPSYSSGTFATYNGASWAADAGADAAFQLYNDNFDITGNISLGAWVKRARTGQIEILISKGASGGSNNGYWLNFKADNTVEMIFGGVSDLYTTATITDTNWHHIVGTSNGSTGNIYIDGVLSKTGNMGNPQNNYYQLAIATQSNGQGGNSFSGAIDEPFVYAEALTADQINNMYTIGRKALQNASTNSLNGSNNQVNAVAVSGLSARLDSSQALRMTGGVLFAGTEGGGVSVIDLTSDTLMRAYTTTTNPAINHVNINALTATTDGNYIAALDSGMSRVNGVSGITNLSTTSYTNIFGAYDQIDGYYKLYENGSLVGRTYVGTSHTPVTNSGKLVMGGTIPGLWSIDSDNPLPINNFYGAIDNVNIYNYAVNAREINLQNNAGVNKPVLDLPFDEGDGVIAHNRAWQKVGTTTNIFINPSVETNISNYNNNVSGTTRTQSVDTAVFGSYSQKVVADGTLSGQGWYTTFQTGSPSTFYSTSVFVKGASGNLLFALKTSPGALTIGSATATLDGTWKRLTISGISSSTTAQIYAYLITSGAQAITFYSDGLQIEQYGATTPYCDGSLTGNGTYAWNGTAHASTSTCTYGAEGILNNGVTWKQTGVKGGSLSFGASSDDYVEVIDTPATSFTGDFSLSTWINPTSVSNNQWILRKIDGGDCTSTSSGWGLSYRSNNTLMLLNGTAGCGGTSGTIGVQANKWNYLTVVYRGTTAQFYLNGVLKSTVTGISIPNDSLSTLRIGSKAADAEDFIGSIDEMKLFPYALTPSEIKREFDNSSPTQLGSPAGANTTDQKLTFGQAQDYCVPGSSDPCTAPVAEWKFDENTGTTVADSSENSNTGVINGATWNDTGCKQGSCLHYDGVDDYVIMNQTQANPLFAGQTLITVEFWVKPLVSETSKHWIEYGIGNSTFSLEGNTGNAIFYTNNSSAITTVLDMGQWNHIALVMDGTNKIIYKNGIRGNSIAFNSAINNSNSAFDIGGRGATRNTNSIFDKLLIYNYARTAAQIAWDYNKGAPVAYYKLDECQGTTANDASGNANNGTITIGSGGTQTNTSAGNCESGFAADAWSNGAIGKLNTSLNLDGIDDHINMGDPVSGIFDFGANQDFSLSAWVKLTDNGTYQAIVYKGVPDTNGNIGYGLTVGTGLAGNPVRVQLRDSDNNTVLITSTVVDTADGNWHHIAFTADRDANGIIYVDGKNVAQSSIASPDNSLGSVNSLRIGAHSTVPTAWLANGQIDEVQVYNYALTADQIKEIFNKNSAVRFE